MTIVDETLILRYLLDDDPEKSRQARDLIAQGNASTFPEILARVAVTLRDVYGVPRPVIGAAIDTLLDDVLVEEESVVRLALRLFGSTQLDFTDCMMVARQASSGDALAAFDKPLIGRVLREHGEEGRLATSE